MSKPDYINKKIKKVSEIDLLVVLHKLNEEHKQRRREDREALNKALADGFRCGPKL